MIKLVIVDDDRLTSSLLQTLFELEGFDVICVAESNRVIPVVEREEPSAVLLDFHVGSTESTTLIRQMRGNPRLAGMSIVVFSGEDRSKETLAAGANRFVLKPFAPDSLVQIVREMASD